MSKLWKTIKKMIIEDRLVTPFITYEYLSTQTKYIDFPLFQENDYQKCRYYSDELPMKLDNFLEMTKCKTIKEYQFKICNPK